MNDFTLNKRLLRQMYNLKEKVRKMMSITDKDPLHL